MKNLIQVSFILVITITSFISCNHAPKNPYASTSSSISKYEQSLNEGNLQEALLQLDKAIIDAQDKSDVRAEAQFLSAKALIHTILDQPQLASEMLQKAKLLEQRLPELKHTLAIVEARIALWSMNIDLSTKKFNSALHDLKDFKLPASANFPPTKNVLFPLQIKTNSKMSAYLGLALIHAMNNKWDNALKNLNSLFILADEYMEIVKHPTYKNFLDVSTEFTEILAQAHFLRGYSYLNKKDTKASQPSFKLSKKYFDELVLPSAKLLIDIVTIGEQIRSETNKASSIQNLASLTSQAQSSNLPYHAKLSAYYASKELLVLGETDRAIELLSLANKTQTQYWSSRPLDIQNLFLNDVKKASAQLIELYIQQKELTKALEASQNKSLSVTSKAWTLADIQQRLDSHAALVVTTQGLKGYYSFVVSANALSVLSAQSANQFEEIIGNLKNIKKLYVIRDAHLVTQPIGFSKISKTSLLIDRYLVSDLADVSSFLQLNRYPNTQLSKAFLMSTHRPELLREASRSFSQNIVLEGFQANISHFLQASTYDIGFALLNLKYTSYSLDGKRSEFSLQDNEKISLPQLADKKMLPKAILAFMESDESKPSHFVGHSNSLLHTGASSVIWSNQVHMDFMNNYLKNYKTMSSAAAYQKAIKIVLKKSKKPPLIFYSGLLE